MSKEDNEKFLYIETIKNNYVYVMVALISTLVFVLSLLIYKCYPFGSRFPLNGNGYYQSYTFFVGQVNSIKRYHAVGLANYSTGIFSENYYIVVEILLQPWKYLLYLLVPESLYELLFLSQFWACFVLSGLSFVYYLTHRENGNVLSKKSPILIVFGLAYGLSAYTICFFIYLNFYFMPLVPFIFLELERLIYKKSILLYILSLSYFMATDAYYAFILCIFAVFYFVIQKYTSIKDFCKTVIRFAYSSFIAAGLAAAFLIPYYFRTSNSPYDAGDSQIPGILDLFDNLLVPLSEYRALREGVITTQNNARVNLYCGIFALILLPAYFMLKNVSKQEKIKRFVVIVITYLAFDNELLNFVFHGFHHQWQVPNRFSFFLIFLILQCAYDVVINYEELDYKQVLHSYLLTFVIISCGYLWMFLNNRIARNEIISYSTSLGFILLYGILLLLLFKKNKSKYLNISLFVLGIELAVSAVFSFNVSITGLDMENETRYIDDIKELTEDIEDIHSPFVITERPGTVDNQNFSFLANLNSLSFYSSASCKQQADLLYRWGVLFSNNISYYSMGSPVSDMMLHVKYHIVNKEDVFSYSPYPVIRENDRIQICRNNYVLPLGVVFEENSKLDDYNIKSESIKEYDNTYERDNEFADCFGIGKLYEEIEITRINELSEDLNVEENYYIKDEDEEGNGYYSFFIGTQLEGDVYVQIAHSLEYIGTAHKGSCDTLYFLSQYSTNLHEDKITVCVLNKENLSSLYDVLNSNTMTDVRYNLNSIVGKVDSGKDGILYFAMPNLPGVTVYIDGQKQEKISYLDGVAVNISKGVHDVKISYISQGLIPGMIVSGIFLLVLLFVCFMRKKLNKTDN